jgi:hypothetical protein
MEDEREAPAEEAPMEEMSEAAAEALEQDLDDVRRRIQSTAATALAESYAFPLTAQHLANPGMTYREWLIGMIAAGSRIPSDWQERQNRAARVIQMADDLIRLAVRDRPAVAQRGGLQGQLTNQPHGETDEGPQDEAAPPQREGMRQ